MTNGPAPTGSWAKAFSPILLKAASEMIQFGIVSYIWLMNAPSGRSRFTWMVSVPSTLITPGAGGEVGTCGLPGAPCHSGAQVQLDSRSRVQFQATTEAVSGVPSENLTPGRRSMVIVLLLLEYWYPVARSSICLPPAPSSKRSPGTVL